MAGRQHLHHDDAPSALSILPDLLDHRASFPEGYEATEDGAWVDWDALNQSWLSSTEKATVHIARGCATAERQDSLSLEVTGSVRSAVEEPAGSCWMPTPEPIDLTDPTTDPYALAEPVGLDRYDPYGPEAEDRLDEWDGAAWRYVLIAERLAERRRRGRLPEAAEGESGVGP